MDIRADVGILSGTRIAAVVQHTRAQNGLLQAGYIANSHNVAPPGSMRPNAEAVAGPRSSGVIIVARRDVVGSRSAVELGPHGCAIAANLPLQSGAQACVVGLYGPRRS